MVNKYKKALDQLVSDLYTEKYRPQKIDDCILPDKIKVEFSNMILNENVPHLFLVGGAGVGKTTIAKILMNELNCEYLVFNGSSGELNISTLRNKITDFMSTVPLNKNIKYKFVLIDEADGLSKDIQEALRHLMEKYNKGRFILTGNYQHKVIEPLRSRCATINFKFNKEESNNIIKKFAHRILYILNEEKIDYDIEGVSFVCKEYFPDFRRTINEIQRYINFSGKLDLGIKDNAIDSVEELFRCINNKDFKSIKNWVVNNNIISIFDLLFNNYESYIPEENHPLFIMVIGEGMEYHNTTPNQELNTLRTLTRYIDNI